MQIISMVFELIVTWRQFFGSPRYDRPLPGAASVGEREGEKRVLPQRAVVLSYTILSGNIVHQSVLKWNIRTSVAGFLGKLNDRQRKSWLPRFRLRSRWGRI